MAGRRRRARVRNFRSRKAYLAWNRGEKFARNGRLSRHPETIEIRGRRIRVSHRKHLDRHGRGRHWVKPHWGKLRGRKVWIPGHFAHNPRRGRGRK
jgi:hypothetical protein